MSSTATPLGQRTPWPLSANPAGGLPPAGLAGASTWTSSTWIPGAAVRVSTTGGPGWGASSFTQPSR